MIDLIIFDLDGTLAKIYTLNLLPGVAAFFRLVYPGRLRQAAKTCRRHQPGRGGDSLRPGTRVFRPPRQLSQRGRDRGSRLRGLVALTGGGEIPSPPIFRYMSATATRTAKASGPQSHPRRRRTRAGLRIGASPRRACCCRLCRMPALGQCRPCLWATAQTMKTRLAQPPVTSPGPPNSSPENLIHLPVD